MCWWRREEVRITHLPSGFVAIANEGTRSLHRLRYKAIGKLRAMFYAKLYGPLPLRRTYEIPDNAHTIDDLETGKCVDYDR